MQLSAAPNLAHGVDFGAPFLLDMIKSQYVAGAAWGGDPH
jgi:hypothetical protein